MTWKLPLTHVILDDPWLRESDKVRGLELLSQIIVNSKSNIFEIGLQLTANLDYDYKISFRFNDDFD